MPPSLRTSSTKPTGPTPTGSDKHTEAELALRPKAGAQPRFKKHKPAQIDLHDSWLSPSMEWDGRKPVREEIAKYGQVDMPATYLQATKDLPMGELLKNICSSYVFSVCGLPEDHLADTVNASFKAGEQRQVAVKVIDSRGNKLLVVRKLETGGKK